MSTARAIADLSEGTILATVDIAVPPERVFRALTTDEVTRWWGSADTYRTTEWTADLRVGGRWRSGGRGSDGKPFVVEGEYLELDPPRRIVQTWKPDWDGSHVTTITYHLDPIEGGTRLTLRHTGFGARADSCARHAQGWERVLGWLNGHVAARADKFFMCRLIGPRPTFPADMTPEERAVMLEHVAYWTEQMHKGTAIVFGPVAEPTGVWGMGVIRVGSPEEAQALTANDPTVRSGLGFRLEAHPMLNAVTRA